MVAESKLIIKKELARVTVTWGCLPILVQGRYFRRLDECNEIMFFNYLAGGHIAAGNAG